MDKKRTTKIMGDIKVIEALIGEVDVAPGKLTKIEGSIAWEWVEDKEDKEITEVYVGEDGTVYPVAYYIGKMHPVHDVLFTMAAQCIRRICPDYSERPVRFVTIVEGSVEVTGFPPMVRDGIFASVTETKAEYIERHYDKSNSKAVTELLGLLRGETITPSTQLGQAAKEALER